MFTHCSTLFLAYQIHDALTGGQGLLFLATNLAKENAPNINRTPRPSWTVVDFFFKSYSRLHQVFNRNLIQSVNHSKDF